MADWLFANEGALALAASKTTYLTPSGDMRASTSEAFSKVMARASYTCENLLVSVLSNTSPNATTVQTRKNTANGAMSVSIGASATGLFEDTANSDSLVATDLFDYKVVSGASAVCTLDKISTTLNDAGTNPPQISGDPAVGTLTFNTTRYACVEGTPTLNATEAKVQDKYTTQSTMTNLRMQIGFNNITTATTGTLRVNAGAGNNTVSITASTTGAFEDTTHTDTLTASDLVNVQLVSSGAASGSLSMTHVSVLTVATGRRLQTNWARTAITQAFGVTAPYFLAGGTATITEANAQLKCRIACVFKNLFFYTPTNTVNGTSTLTLRQNGANSALTVSIGASATGAFNDTTNSVTTVAADLMNWQLVTGGTTGTMTLMTLGVEQTNPATGLPPGLGPLPGMNQPTLDAAMAA